VISFRSLVLIGVFINFFGFYIVRLYVDQLDLGIPTPFQWNSYSFQAIVEMSVVFFFCCVATFIFSKKRQESVNFIYYYKRRYFFWICTFFFIVLSFYYLYSANYGFNVSGRGEGQFSRSLTDSLARAILLVLPLFVYYRIAYSGSGLARCVAVLFVIAISFYSLSYGDRRLLIYFLLAYLFIVLREQKLAQKKEMKIRKVKTALVPVASLALIVAAYYFRSSSAHYPGYLALQSTLGALGVGAILSEIKVIVENNTGFLMGQSFATYLWVLFVPGFVLYLFGGNEFVFRSSYEFNDIFNDNPNMGYDFMMLADFYWNFGYFGYFLFVVLFCFVIRFLSLGDRSCDDFKFASSIIMTVFFVAGQRSDFGFFLKSFVYCEVFIIILFSLFAVRKRVDNDFN